MINEVIELQVKLSWMKYCKEYVTIPNIQQIKLINDDDDSLGRVYATDLYKKSYILYVKEEIFKYPDTSIDAILFHEFTHITDSLLYLKNDYQSFKDILSTYSEFHASKVEMEQLLKSVTDDKISGNSEITFNDGILTINSLMNQAFNHIVNGFAIISKDTIESMRNIYYYCGFSKTLKLINLVYDFNYLKINPEYMLFCKNISDELNNDSDINIKNIIKIENKILEHIRSESLYNNVIENFKLR